MAASQRPAAFAARSIVESFHDIGPRPMSGVHDSSFFLSSSSGDSRLFNSENAVRSDDGAMRRHIARHDGIRAHGGIAAYAHRAEHFRARADEHVILDDRHCAAL